MIVLGVVDRISNGYAVIISESIKREFHIEKSNFKEGDWVDIELKNDEVKDVKKNIEKTKERKRLTHKKTEKLRKRMGSNYDK